MTVLEGVQATKADLACSETAAGDTLAIRLTPDLGREV